MEEIGKKSGTSYQYLWVAKHAYKNFFFGLTIESGNGRKKRKEMKKHWISQEQKELCRGIKNYFS